ncbi:MAG: MFS transporter [Candidatus Latescibacteria bacterium]|nr:MFS transporter [Candidatus Latescibacterota bacterium]
MKGGTERDRTVFGWCLYDWANSAFATTTVGAMLPVYFADAVVPKAGVRVPVLDVTTNATTLWGVTVGGSALIVALVAPTLGAIADFSARKKLFLTFFCCIGGLSATSMYVLRPGDVGLAMLLMAVGNIGFVGGNVFYDAFLPHLAEPDRLDAVSGRGYACGYAGGGLLFLINLLVVQYHEALGLGTAVRLSLCSAGLWWLGFGLVALHFMYEAPAVELLPRGVSTVAFGIQRTWQTFRKALRHRHLWMFLAAFMIYNDAIQTVLSMAAIYGKAELGFEMGTLLGCFLMIQIVAAPGALLFGWIAGRVGTKRTIMGSLLVWMGVAFYAYRMTQPSEFWILGGIVGLVLGGSQALSRSLYGAFIPKEASAEFYGFFSVFNKFSAVWGPLVFGIVRHYSGTSRLSILLTGVFFLIGLVLLGLVDEEKAAEARGVLQE